MPPNQAAYLVSPKDKALKIKDAPYPIVGPSEIIVQVAAVAINPLEKNIQDYNPPLRGQPIAYPLLMGSDVAGTIIEIGSDVSNRSVGQRVILNAHGVATGQAAHAGFQNFVVAGTAHTIPLPDDIPFENGVVLPLACDTAAAGLFGKDQLNLSLSQLTTPPTSGPNTSSNTSKGTLLIWGGSSSVGSSAIQLAHAAGYTILTTASPHNHSLCRSLGAAHVFAHSDPDVESHILHTLHGQPLVGALDCIANKENTMLPCARILAKAQQVAGDDGDDAGGPEAGGTKKLLTVLTPPETELAEGVKAVRVNIPSFIGSEEYGVVHAWMARALADGGLLCKPDPKVVGTGLEAVQSGIDEMRRGVSAVKLVVRL